MNSQIPDGESSPSVAAVASALRAGGVALVPTDTVYGLAVLPGLEAAVRRVFELKDRPLTRNLPVMVAGPDRVRDLGVDVTAAAAKLLASDLMPGPVTLALGFGPGPGPEWLTGRDEVALRIPGNAWLRELLARTGPLLVTSANAHAQATRESVPGILAQLRAAPDVVVDHGPLDVVPSTLVNCRKVPPEVERVGAVPVSVIEEVIS
jgi:L-threonylcarbamoyladenylate synthase